MQKLKVGLIGYGAAGAFFHAPLILAEPRLQLTQVATRRPLTAELAAAHSVRDPLAVIRSNDIDLVVIASPNSSHAELARAALLAGKDVVVDKPFTLTLAEAEELVSLAERSGRLLTVFHNRRFDDHFLTVRALIEAGELTGINYCAMHFDRYRPGLKGGWREQAQPGSGIFFDLGAHLIDQALVLFGMPTAVFADLAIQRSAAAIDDYFHLQLNYPDKRVLLHASCLATRPGPRFLAHGKDLTVVQFGLDRQEADLRAGLRPGDAAWGRSQNMTELHRPTGVERRPCLSGRYTAFYASVADSLLQGSAPAVTPTEAINVMRVIAAGLHSSREGRRVMLA